MVIFPLNMVIFHSYVSLPEGSGFPLVSLVPGGLIFPGPWTWGHLALHHAQHGSERSGWVKSSADAQHVKKCKTGLNKVCSIHTLYDYCLFPMYWNSRSIGFLLSKPPKEHHKITVFFFHSFCAPKRAPVRAFSCFDIYIYKQIFMIVHVYICIYTYCIYQCYYHYYYNYSYIVIIIVIIDIIVFSGYCCCHCCCGCYCNGIIDIHIIIVMNNISICGIPSKCVLIVKNDQHCTTLIGFSDPRFRPEWIRHVWKCLLKATMDPWNGYLHWEKHSQTIFFGVPFWFPESVSTNLFARVNGWLGRDSFATWNTSGWTEQSCCQFWLKIDPPKILLDPLPTLPKDLLRMIGGGFTFGKCHSPWVSVLHWGLAVWHSVCDLSNLSNPGIVIPTEMVWNTTVYPVLLCITVTMHFNNL